MKPERKSDPGAAVVGVLLAPPAMLWSGFVASRMWGWFVVPQFDVKPLPIAVAIGLGVFIGFWFKPWKTDDDPYTWEYLGRSVGSAIWWPALALLIGWIVQHWVAR